VALIALAAAGAAGCSADTSRFGNNPFSGSIASNGAPPADVAHAAPTSQVASQQLPPPGMARPSASAPYGHAPLTAQEPPPIQMSAPAAPSNVANAGVHVVAPGETINSLSRLYGKPVSAIARANGLATDTRLRIGQRVTIPGVTQAQINSNAKARQPATAVASATPAGATPPAKPESASQKVASAQPAATASLAAPAADPTNESDASSGAPSFRWPVRGRVVSGFGTKIGGQQNDGINLSVPEGTSIKAAEDGVVAYAGNELKGYGNLVLVRHSGGFVTAYAHASEVLVKRGDRIKRGQIIARAGQTGNVTAPQLHFEIRKGSTPVDPMQFLQSARADL
jgi:murein DD-endopeptidase MepM/ murein hydrolase activator NlpD